MKRSKIFWRSTAVFLIIFFSALYEFFAFFVMFLLVVAAAICLLFYIIACFVEAWDSSKKRLVSDRYNFVKAINKLIDGK